MGKIHVMDDLLANKIAAGEVVEKISSVVKELVENSIDAASNEIKIELKNSGFNGIIITDNGIGMDHDDAILAFERHATSKLIKEDDLFFINTLGFRGEALPSIASVSEVDLKTSNGKVGTHIVIKGGKKEIDESSDLRLGTKIKVTNLFYNTPARLKYLKTEQTELANCMSFVEKIALAYPNIRFSLSNNDKILLKTTGSNDLAKTIHEVYGLSISSKLIEIKASNDDYDIYGYICKPEILKSNRNFMITFVNGRLVKNYELNKAINDAYYTYKPDIKYPIVFIKIETDPTLIDVNIHPTKQDIKLSKINGLYDLINKTIKDALYNNLLIPDATLRIKEELRPDPIVLNNIINDLKIEEETINYGNRTKDKVVLAQTTFDFGDIEETPVKNIEMKSLVLYPVGQALGTYIIAENDDGMYLVDQHAAEERINYERIQKALKEKSVKSQSLLIPITIELSPSDALILSHHLDYLESIGFLIEEFGVNTFAIKAEPIWIRPEFEEATVRDIIDQVILKGNDFDIDKFNDHMAKSAACKMSIKANMKIGIEDMEQILKDLVLCDNPYNCCHGRPSIIKFSNYDLERMFKRVMN